MMASESGDKFGGGSPPNASHLTEDESFEDLLGTLSPVDFADLPMPDLDDDFPMPSPSHGPNPAPEAEPQSEDESMVDLPNLDTLLRMSNSKTVNGGVTKTGKQAINREADLTASDRIRSLLTSDTELHKENVADSDDALPAKSPSQISMDKKVAIKQEPPEIEVIMSRFVSAEVIDLCDIENVVIRKEGRDEPFDWKIMADETVSISDSDDEEQAVLDDETLLPASLSRARQTSGMTNIYGDREDVVIKKEVRDEPFDWKTMADETVSISDSDDEEQAVLDDEMLIPASLSRARQKSGMTNIYGDEIVELESGKEQGSAPVPRLGTSLLGRKINPRPKPTPEDIAKQRQQQRVFKERMLGKSGISGPAVLFKGLNGSRCPGLDSDDIDDDSWMSSDTNFDEEAAIKFRELKRSYKVKTKAAINTVEDDHEFQRAEKVEKARLKRLKLEYLASRGPASDEDASDEDGLFVSPSPPRRAKRRITADDDDDSNTQGRKKRRQTQTRKQAPDKLEKDLEWNLMAGIDSYFLKERREASKEKDKEKVKKSGKVGKEALRAEKTGKAQSNAHGKKTSAKINKAPPKKRPTQAGFLNNAGSLLNSNVFEDADANRDLTPLPISTEKNKAKALAALVANVPLGNIRRSEKEHIRRATITLGKHNVNPDGQGGWKFTGMDSSLRHHQVQGAAWMKERELGDSEPLGVSDLLSSSDLL